MVSCRFRSLIFHAFFLSFTATVAPNSATTTSNSEDCVYTLYVKTGSIIKSGTDSKISVEIEDEFGDRVQVNDVEEWGMMGPNHEYFEWGNLDIFTGRGPCMGTRICRLNLTSDGTGQHHGWYCDYLQVTSTGAHQGCSKTIFEVQQWLATDAPPYRLSAVLDGCGQQKLGITTDQTTLVVKNDHSNDFQMNDHHMPGGSDAPFEINDHHIPCGSDASFKTNDPHTPGGSDAAL
ncbi:PLAT domain-containing protein 2-like [Macadamia integrifolia]|uniref:PLAT domain-containing protein 2-like n=1 Tax=Macadamia integrifolia TaxID=60698 RepID=UPI001C4E7BD6|nr:PLAT domain-containing protein 2-like [Macadamia integrifolia]